MELVGIRVWLLGGLEVEDLTRSQFIVLLFIVSRETCLEK